MSAAAVEAIPLSASCICGDVRLDHKMGKGLCKVADCGCDQYEQLDGPAPIVAAKAEQAPPAPPVTPPRSQPGVAVLRESTSAALARVAKERDDAQRISKNAERLYAHQGVELQKATAELASARQELEQLRAWQDDVAALIGQAEATGNPRITKAAAFIRKQLAALREDVMDHQRGAELRDEQARLEARLAEIRTQLKPPRPARTGPDHKAVRAWAKANGVECPATGRAPDTVIQAYLAATKTPEATNA